MTLVDADRPRGGKPVELRQVVDGIRWVLYTQAHWSDIPATYAASTTCWRWYSRGARTRGRDLAEGRGRDRGAGGHVGAPAEAQARPAELELRR